MTEYFRAEWRNRDSIIKRYSQGPFHDTYDEANNFAVGMMNNWKTPEVEFRISHTKIELAGNKRTTTETYYELENPYVNISSS